MSDYGYTTTPPDIGKMLNYLEKDYSRQIRLKPLKDKTWSKLITLLETLDERNIRQAISLAESIDDRYLASTYEYLQQAEEYHDVDEQIDEMYYSGQPHWFHFLTWIWDIEWGKTFKSWIYRGKPISSSALKKDILKRVGIKNETQVIVENLKLDYDKKYILIDFEGNLIQEKDIDASCTTHSMVSMGQNTQITVTIEDIDKIDISNALTYTDTYPDEENRVQRGVLYLQMPFIENERFELDAEEPPLIEWTGTLHFVRENGQAWALDQDVGVTLRLNFDGFYIRELGAQGW